MNRKDYEERLENYKQQKKQLMQSEERLLELDYCTKNVFLLRKIDESIDLADAAIITTMNIIDKLIEVEKETEKYEVIAGKLQKILINDVQSKENNN